MSVEEGVYCDIFVVGPVIGLLAVRKGVCHLFQCVRIVAFMIVWYYYCHVFRCLMYISCYILAVSC
jgi:hypothetical protein